MWAVVAFLVLFGLRALVDDVASPPESPSPSSDGGARRALSIEEIEPGDRERLLADVDLRSCERVAPTYVGTSTASPTRFCEREVGRLVLLDSEHTVDEILDAFGETASPIKELGDVSIGTEQGYRVVMIRSLLPSGDRRLRSSPWARRVCGSSLLRGGTASQRRGSEISTRRATKVGGETSSPSKVVDGSERRPLPATFRCPSQPHGTSAGRRDLPSRRY
jgi:hypothetical protein